jgi:hypothetical protein
MNEMLNYFSFLSLYISFGLQPANSVPAFKGDTLYDKLIMELDLPSLYGLLCTAVLIGRDPATPPRGRYWSAKIDDISL